MQSSLPLQIPGYQRRAPKAAGTASPLNADERAPAVERQRFHSLYWLTLFASCCILSGGFLPVGRFAGVVEVLDPGVSDPWANALQGFVLALMALSMLLNWRRVITSAPYTIPFMIVWSYTLLTTVWSADPSVSFRRGLLLLMNFLFGLFSYSTFGTRGVMRIMYQASWFMIVTSLILFVLAPSIGQDVGDYSGALRGVFAQKNVTAWAFMLALSYVGYELYETRHVTWRFLLGASLVVACLVLTKSTTEVLSAPLLVGFWIWSSWYRAAEMKMAPLLVGLSVVGLGAFAYVALGDAVYGLIGKDSTLTGRSAIWEMAHYVIAQRPVWGWGFQGFWTPFNPAAQEVWNVMDWQAPHAHNGILELLIELGYFGLALFSIWMLYLFTLIVSGIRRDSPVAWWTLSYLILVLLKAQTEPVYIQVDMATSLLAFSTVCLGAERAHAQANNRIRRIGASLNRGLLSARNRSGTRDRQAVGIDQRC